jgi:ABC-type transport system involved in cytochrome c biogenesis ATPase subunit
MDLTTEHLDRGGMCIMAAHQDVEIGGNVTRIMLT